MELSQRAPPILGWAAITLGIGPHSIWFCFDVCVWVSLSSFLFNKSSYTPVFTCTLIQCNYTVLQHAYGFLYNLQPFCSLSAEVWTDISNRQTYRCIIKGSTGDIILRKKKTFQHMHAWWENNFYQRQHDGISQQHSFRHLQAQLEPMQCLKAGQMWRTS